jgi:hypothetical protein
MKRASACGKQVVTEEPAHHALRATIGNDKTAPP